MIVVVSECGAPIWERRTSRNGRGGLANRSHLLDGTQEKIVEALRDALEQAAAQLRGACFQVGDVIPDVGAASAKIYDYVPIVGVRNGDPRGKHSIESSVIPMRATVPIVAKVTVVHD